MTYTMSQITMNSLLALIIEDNDGISSLYEEALQVAGFNTQIVRDGQSAITTLDETQPDIIVLDLNLPHVSGHYILRHLRASSNSKMSNIPVIISTANNVMADAMRQELGENDYLLVKPVDIRQLQHMAKRILKIGS